ncbi:hypothetical protein OG436_00090 [Streptomyces caniferus]|nr:hypothetical protein [Streptomyces caniferus]
MPKSMPRIVVHPPALNGGRRVHVDAEILGVAYNVAFTDRGLCCS